MLDVFETLTGLFAPMCETALHTKVPVHTVMDYFHDHRSHYEISPRKSILHMYAFLVLIGLLHPRVSQFCM